ncbi:MAG: hypothetical protein ACYTGX_05300 [Planctomycetota bacterium]
MDIDTSKLDALMQPGESLSSYFRANRKQAGLLDEGILVLTNQRFLWMENTGDPITATYDQTIGAAAHDTHLALRFQEEWLNLFFDRPRVAADAAKNIGVLLNKHRGT